jgi:hypothetical protein
VALKFSLGFFQNLVFVHARRIAFGIAMASVREHDRL